MKQYTRRLQNYAIFKAETMGGVWMLHFIWGKKDFRLYLQEAQPSLPLLFGRQLTTVDHKVLQMTRFQYLYNFTWWEYQGVKGHGLALEEVRWINAERQNRYLEVPKDFLECAMEMACHEFNLALIPEQTRHPA